MVLAVKSAEGGYAFGPPASRLLAAGEVLIVAGSAEQVANLMTATRTGA